MAAIQTGPGAPLSRPLRPSMNTLRSRSQLLSPARTARRFWSPALDPSSGSGASVLARSFRVRDRASDALLKEEWLDSLSFPFSQKAWQKLPAADEEAESGSDAEWVVGIDPDVTGAVSLLKPDGAGISAREMKEGLAEIDILLRDHYSPLKAQMVFDTPNMEALVGKKVRKRLDTRSMIQLLQSFGAPIGTTAFIEQSSPCPQDGKQGWWSGGFSYGLWIGILVASGFTVVPVASRVWKDHFYLYRSSMPKDDSRKVASVLFPSLDSSLKRKKDHGRADALLIAAYGKGLKLQQKP